MESPFLEEYNCTCPTCQRVFVSNHLNRRYCSAQCKVLANNRKARLLRNDTKRAFTIIARNYQILRGYDHNGIVSRLNLIAKGFNFAYQTHSVFDKQGVSWLAVHDRAYQFTDSTKKEVKIVDLTTSQSK